MSYTYTISFNHGGSELGGGRTLAECCNMLRYSLDFHVNENGRVIGEDIDIRMDCLCGTCSSVGTVRKPVRGRMYGKQVRCPECKGKPPVSHINVDLLSIYPSKQARTNWY